MDTLVPVGDTTLELVDIESWMDDEPGCMSALGCDKTAQWSCMMRCCGDSALLCDTCLDKARSLIDGKCTIKCRLCGHYFGVVCFEQVVRAIPL